MLIRGTEYTTGIRLRNNAIIDEDILQEIEEFAYLGSSLALGNF